MAEFNDLARAVLEACRAAGFTVATAESCTGGMIAAALTDIAGASDVFDRGYVTYSNAAKTASLGVPAELIATNGAVSREVAGAMAAGTRDAAGVSLAVSVTGIAGPGGGSALKPVGLVWFGLAAPGRVETTSAVFAGDRAAIRRQATLSALGILLDGAGRRPL